MRTIVLMCVLVGQCVLLGTTAASAQSSSPVELASSEVHQFRTQDGTLYEVYIAFPLEYEADKDAKYPVLYVTDASLVFALVTQTSRFLMRGRDIQPVLLVGIDRPTDSDNEALASRVVDLTPTQVTRSEQSMASQYGHEVNSGGADTFIAVLNDEIIPWVEGRWPVSDQRGIMGYSLGGLFVAHLLFTSPRSFNQYFIGSPSLWWDGGVTFEQLELFAQQSDSIPARVFLSVGTGESSSMLLNMVKMAQTIMGRRDDAFELEYQFLQDETHTSGIPSAMSRGLRFLYGNR